MTKEAIGHAGTWRKVQVVDLYPETQGTSTWALFIRMQRKISTKLPTKKPEERSKFKEVTDHLFGL